MGSTVAFGSGLLVVSIGLIAWNVLAWRRGARTTRDQQVLAFERKQLRSRLQISGMIGLVGAAVIGSIWILGPLAGALYWLGILLAVLWLFFSGLADMHRSRSFYQRLRDQQLVENAALRAKLENLRRRDGNGQPRR